jgi:hypothetical protein
MSLNTHPGIEGKIERLFQGKLPDDQARELVTHLRDCQPCLRLYERFAGAEKAMFVAEGKRSPDLNPYQEARVSQRLFATTPAKPRWSPKLLWSTGLLASALSALLLVSVTNRAHTPTETFGARGGGVPEKKAPDVSFRALRLRQAPDGRIEVSDLASGLEGVRPGDRIKLLYTNFGKDRFAEVAALGAGGRVLPLAGQTEVRSDAEDQVFGDSIVVSTEWPSGPIRIVARFSETPTENQAWTEEGGQLVRSVDTHVDGALK